MMGFFSRFRSQMPDIISRLSTIREDLSSAQKSLRKLELLEKELSSKEHNIPFQEKILKEAISDFGVAIWIKDLDGRFLFANKTCCERILKCPEEVVLNMRNGDLKRDAMAQVCMRGDKKVLKNRITMRFIEHAIYDHGHVFLDTVKSPFYDEQNTLIGITGSAVEITDSIPDTIKEHHKNSGLVEIPLNATLSRDRFVEFLERRSDHRE